MEKECQYSNLPVGVFTLSIDSGHLLECNEEFVNIVGFEDIDSCLNRYIFSEHCVDISDYKMMIEHLKKEGKVVDFELRILNEYKDPCWITVYANMRDNDTIAGLIVDITKHKDIEDQFVELQGMSIVKHLSMGAIHELNNILSSISLNSEVARYSLEEGSFDEKELLQQFNIINKGAYSVGNLISLLLTFTKPIQDIKRDVDLNDIVNHVITLLVSGFASTTPYFIKPDLQTKKYIYANKCKVSQALVNLAINAKEAMPNGGTLTIETQDVVVDEEIKGCCDVIPPGNYVKLTVADEGVGIPEENRSRIFQLFFTTKTKDSVGAGLGLAITRDMTNRHAAYIDIETKLGAGSSVSIYFPAVDKKEVSLEMEEVTDEKITGRILLVDDETMILKMAEQFFKKRGYDFVTASNGEDALKVYQEGNFDLVIIDMIMSPMDGAELFNKLRKINPEAIIYVMSGYYKDRKVQRILAKGGAGFLSKPVHLEDVEKTIRLELLKNKKNK